MWQSSPNSRRRICRPCSRHAGCLLPSAVRSKRDDVCCCVPDCSVKMAANINGQYSSSEDSNRAARGLLSSFNLARADSMASSDTESSYWASPELANSIFYLSLPNGSTLKSIAPCMRLLITDWIVAWCSCLRPRQPRMLRMPSPIRMSGLGYPGEWNTCTGRLGGAYLKARVRLNRGC